MRRALATLVALLVTGTAAFAAGDYDRQAAEYTLTEQRPSRGTSEHFVFDYVNPDDPNAKPPAVRRVVTILPRGARYDTSVPDVCTASDAELMAQGGAACPAGSAIGGGVITVDTGAPGDARIVTADVEFFNNVDQFIYVNTVRGTDARTVIRAEVDRDRTITNADMLPGTPPDGGAIDTVDIHVDNVSYGSRNYITTPPVCRGRRSDPHWTARVQFTYADGVSQTVPSHTACKRPNKAPQQRRNSAPLRSAIVR
jgi:hypothetical protein